MNDPLLKIQDIFLENELLFYKKGVEYFHLELVTLNSNIFILDHVLTYPFHLFKTGGLFFRYVFENFFYMSLIIITRMLTDTGDELFTLPKFKYKIRKSIKPEYQKLFDGQMKNVRFNSEIKNLEKKAQKLRNERIAHAKEAIVLEITPETIIKYGELKILRDGLETLFKALCFDTLRLTFAYENYNRPDIEVILDWVAEKSSLINLPEKNPDSWSGYRDWMPKQDLKIFNEYRKKFHLPEA